jgi:uncharacterized protein
MSAEKPFRVLSLDGGGMRGIYTASYLSLVAATFARKTRAKALDVGAAFDLIVGTSTGAIIASALAAGVPLESVVDLYRNRGKAIFEQPLRGGRALLALFNPVRRRHALARGTEALRSALTECLGDVTLGEMYRARGVALSITAVEMSNHRSWVFKTPHNRNTNHRDDNYKLVDVCLASSAAPIYRSLASVEHTDGGGYRVFADGGLWANNPVLVGLIDALEMTSSGDRIEVFCLGTCPRPAGQIIKKDDVHRTLTEWKLGGAAAALGIDAQEFAFDNMARMLAAHLDRDCKVVRFPHDQVPAAILEFLDLDETRDEGLEALVNQARTDADVTNSRCGRPDDVEGQLISALFMDAPVLEPNSGEIAAATG